MLGMSFRLYQYNISVYEIFMTATELNFAVQKGCRNMLSKLMTTFFESCSNLDELKKEYRKQAMLHHPDMGGDTATMQAINVKYEARFEILKRCQTEQAAEDTSGRTYATTEGAGDFTEIINALLHIDGITVELCGHWLWIGDDTMKHREELKASGCRWSSTKKPWSWHFAEDATPWHHRSKSMDQIQMKYGSTQYARSAERGEEQTRLYA